MGIPREGSSTQVWVGFGRTIKGLQCNGWGFWKNQGKITVCGFCPFALLPFRAVALLPLPLTCTVVQLSLGGYQMKESFVLVFTFRFMCRYCGLSWCYSCLQRWQPWRSSLRDNLRLCFILLQMLKPYLNIWKLGGGQGAGVGHHGILEYELPSPNIVYFNF